MNVKIMREAIGIDVDVLTKEINEEIKKINNDVVSQQVYDVKLKPSAEGMFVLILYK